MSRCDSGTRLCDADEIGLLRSGVMQAAWSARKVRKVLPSVLYEASKLASRVTKAVVEDVK